MRKLSPRAEPSPWLSIVGIGEDGVAGLAPAARRRVETAELVFGGRRHLELAGSIIRGRTHVWPVPFERGIEAVLASQGRPACVLASGDPFMHGVGSVLARHLPADRFQAYPAPSAFSLAAARLGWGYRRRRCSRPVAARSRSFAGISSRDAACSS
jgi:precorrin-6Y C5,15-methyltransferase (decarboxylating)